MHAVHVVMNQFNRIDVNPSIMGGRPCIRGQRMTVSMLVGMVASGKSTQQILALHPYLEAEDITQALGYAACLAKEIEPLFAKA